MARKQGKPRRSKNPAKATKTSIQLARLKKQALSFATGKVKKFKLDEYTFAYVYTHWRSDTSLEVDILGLVPSKKVRDAALWKYFVDSIDSLDDFCDQARNFGENWVEDKEYDISIEHLCREAEELASSIYEDFEDFDAEFFHVLDDETKKDRDKLIKLYRQKVKEEKGIWTYW